VDARVAGGHAAAKALDKNIRFGETYEYRVQRVARVTVDGQIRSSMGRCPHRCKSRPGTCFLQRSCGLAAVAIIGENGAEPAIDLSGNQIRSDLAGYIVTGARGWELRAFRPHNSSRSSLPRSACAAGRSYIYAVSAVDQGGHESERSGERKRRSWPVKNPWRNKEGDSLHEVLPISLANQIHYGAVEERKGDTWITGPAPAPQEDLRFKLRWNSRGRGL